jgi:hypothetical protein
MSQQEKKFKLSDEFYSVCGVTKDKTVNVVGDVKDGAVELFNDARENHNNGVCAGAIGGLVVTGVLGVAGAVVGTKLALVGAGVVAGGAVIGYTVSRMLK